MEPEAFTHGSPIGGIEKATGVTVKALNQLSEDIFKDAGCKIVKVYRTPEIIINYPEGSTRQEFWPRSLESRFHVRLPDGLELQETENSAGECVALYILLETIPAKFHIPTDP